MIQKLLSQIKLQARLAVSNLATTKMGTIRNYDPENHQVKVEIEPKLENQQTLTGWIPLLSSWVGAQWGIFAAPELGTACVVLFSDSSYSAPMAALGVFNSSYRPLNVPQKEFWLVHSSGSSLKFTNDGNVEIKSNQTVNIDAENVKIGKLSAGNLEKLLKESAATLYNAHIHPVSGAVTGPPTIQIGPPELTEFTEAN